MNFDYCRKCKNKRFSVERGLICGLTDKKPFFEENCENYEADSEPQQEVDTPAPEITAQYLQQNTNMGGWLIFCLIQMILGGIVSIFSAAKSYLEEVSFTVDKWVYGHDVAMAILVAVLAIIVIAAFCNRRRDAVHLAILFESVVLVTNLFVIGVSIYTGFEGDGADFSVASSIRGIIWPVIWILFMIFSNNVSEVIPKDYRRHSPLFWVFLSVAIALPIVCTVGAIASDASIDDCLYESEQMLNSDLNEGEYTDGRIIFKVPQGYDCTWEDSVDDDFSLRTFAITNPNNETETLAVFSLYACNETPESLFEEFHKSVNEGFGVLFSSEIVAKENLTINGRKCGMRVLKLKSVLYGGEFYSVLGYLYDKKTEKIVFANHSDLINGKEVLRKFFAGVKFE